MLVSWQCDTVNEKMETSPDMVIILFKMNKYLSHVLSPVLSVWYRKILYLSPKKFFKNDLSQYNIHNCDILFQLMWWWKKESRVKRLYLLFLSFFSIFRFLFSNISYFFFLIFRELWEKIFLKVKYLIILKKADSVTWSQQS